MKLINSSVQFFDIHPTIEGMFEDIERAGRVCYLSEPTSMSSRDFTNMLINKGHLSPLEFGTVYLLIKADEVEEPVFAELYMFYMQNKYSEVVYRLGDIEETKHSLRVTTNYRVLVENNRLDDLKYFHLPDYLFKYRISVQFTTSIGISREFNRHRSHSIAEQSTRWINFFKEKFGKELTFIKPFWYDSKTRFIKWVFRRFLSLVEFLYIFFIKHLFKPQEARDVLPLITKTELCHCAFTEDWSDFIKLRCAKDAHPDARKLANEVCFNIGNIVELIGNYSINYV